MNSFGLVTILPKLGILMIVLVHAVCLSIDFSQRSAVAKVDVMTTKITTFSKKLENLRKSAKMNENYANWIK